ncbi:MAG: TrmH family RNA methyltransferase [Candidatus Kapabacteria bacterium]|nr:TrmH family RNA methyltransferase [Candidatus Kapabacteria bacterium]
MQKLSYDQLVAVRLTSNEATTALKHPVVAVLHDIRSLYNVGSIFRSADAFGIERLVLCGYTPKPPRIEIAKTALGADLVVPYSECESAYDAMRDLRDAGYHVFAAEVAHGSMLPQDLGPHHFPLAIVFGNELTGVPDDLIALCEGALEIPMFGTKHSLNVAVAAGVLLSTAVNRYRETLP